MVTKSNNKNRRLKYTLQIIGVDKLKYCVNTHITNKIVHDSLIKKRLKI